VRRLLDEAMRALTRRQESIPAFTAFCQLLASVGLVIEIPNETGIGTGNQFIDDLYQVQQRAIDAALVAHGHKVNEVRLIVNSHLHFDHVGAL